MSLAIILMRGLALILSIGIAWGFIRVYKLIQKENLSEKEYVGLRKLLKVILIALWVYLIVGMVLIFLT